MQIVTCLSKHCHVILNPQNRNGKEKKQERENGEGKRKIPMEVSDSISTTK
jgi:hypothetical protein